MFGDSMTEEISRTFILHGEEFKCTEWLFLTNAWEVFIVEAPTNTKDRKLAYVNGFENEMGDVYIPEYIGHIKDTAKGSQLWDLVAPAGANWK